MVGSVYPRKSFRSGEDSPISDTKRENARAKSCYPWGFNQILSQSFENEILNISVSQRESLCFMCYWNRSIFFATFSNSRSMRLFIKEEHLCLKILSRERKQPFFSKPLQRLTVGKLVMLTTGTGPMLFNSVQCSLSNKKVSPRVNQTFAIMMINFSPTVGSLYCIHSNFL